MTVDPRLIDTARHSAGPHFASILQDSGNIFIATQAGLLASKSVAERTAQELNLANNPEFVPQDLLDLRLGGCAEIS